MEIAASTSASSIIGTRSKTESYLDCLSELIDEHDALSCGVLEEIEQAEFTEEECTMMVRTFLMLNQQLASRKKRKASGN